MAILDEEIVEQWLNQYGFFTMRGIKCGVDEIDLLAIKPSKTSPEFWHVEVQVSFRPVGYIGGDTNAKKRTREQIEDGVRAWVEKKFTSRKKKEKRESIVSGSDWKYVLVCANLKDETEIQVMENLGVKVFRYSDILADVVNSKEHQTSSIANNIVEILKYFKK
jgi:hypothetical protein